MINHILRDRLWWSLFLLCGLTLLLVQRECSINYARIKNNASLLLVDLIFPLAIKLSIPIYKQIKKEKPSQIYYEMVSS